MTALRGWRFVVPVLALASAAAAQEPMSITGHVSAGGMPVQGASVRIRELGLGTTTNADGRFTFIVRSSLVRGQTVSLEARHVRYNPAVVQFELTGGTYAHEFELYPVGDSRSAPSTAVASPAAGPIVSRLAARPTLDSTAFDELAGPTDFVSALAGRVVGLDVTSAGTLGGSAPAILRGYHSIIGNTQPLYVVDGIPLENTALLTPGQGFGTGGFDYGLPAQGLPPAEVATVNVLRGPAAAVYGGRGANGVVLITTRSGKGLSGFEVSASQNVTTESPLRLPEFQNAYGQGLDGKFSFFDGAGGGTNDAVAENWGPALQGQAIPQASYTAPRLGDVRPWVPQPGNVSGFFGGGRTLTTVASAQQAGPSESFRIALDRRGSNGVVPSNTLTRQGALLNGELQPASSLTVSGLLAVRSDAARDRPATGDDPTNTIADFARMGRQVDLGALKAHTSNFDEQQISWNYAGFNNPYFALQNNSNRDDRTRWIGGGAASYALTPSLTATARGGIDRYDQTRNFDIAPTWMGGFPFFAGRGDFSQGGFQRQSITASEANLEFSLAGSVGGARRADGSAAGRFTWSGGASHRENSFDVTSRGSDQRPDTGTGPTVSPATLKGDGSTNAVFAAGEWKPNAFTVIGATARNEWYSVLAAGSNSAFYPSITGSLDLLQATGSKGDNLTGAVIHAGWSRDGGEISPLLLTNVFVPPSDSAATIVASPGLSPEITSAFEVGAAFAFLRNRATLDLTVYDENTSGVVLGVPGSGGSFVARNTAQLSNKGVELQATLVPVRSSRGTEWTIGAHLAKNSNTVEDLGTGGTAVALGPVVDGVTLQAREGFALGALVGTGFKRTSSGALQLQNGVPVSDNQQHVLGVMAPDWSGGVTSDIHFGMFDVSALVDGRIGGSVFSTTNLAGMTSGTFEETAVRPDSGQVYPGIDAATGAANTVRATTQAYYHALGSIQEAWIYDASFVKLRDLRVSFAWPLRGYAPFAAQTIRVSLIGRNLAMWSKAPNIDPETALSATSFQGLELGQLPTVRSVGLQISLTP